MQSASDEDDTNEADDQPGSGRPYRERSIQLLYPELKLSERFQADTYGWYKKSIDQIRTIYRGLYGQATNQLEEHILQNMLVVIRNYQEDINRFPASAYQRLDYEPRPVGKRVGYVPRSQRA